MAVADRTYTFRAPVGFGERIRNASALLDELGDTAGADVAERIAAELALALARDGNGLHDAHGNQSAFIRETVELIVSAAEKVASDIEFGRAYAGAADERTADEIAFRQGSRARTAERWRDA